MQDAEIKSILQTVKTIALIGASPKKERPSHGVMQFLLEHGYQVIPVNPGQAGGEILGQKVYASLADIPVAIDMLDVFRASDAVAGIVEEALALNPKPAVLWTQLGVRDENAAKRAEQAGIKVVMDHCTEIEYLRLIGA